MNGRIHRGARAAVLTFVVMIVVAAGVLPACAGDSCCAHATETAVQPPMPCCAETSVKPVEDVDSLPATSPSPQKSAPVVVAVTPAAIDLAFVRVSSPIPAIQPSPPSEPLFLRNAQLLI